MNRPFNEELITAYLDGELTAEEQAQVEQALAEDDRLRRLHDDLRALRGSLQAMPRYTLDASFAERVLRQAERAMLSQRETSDATSAAATSNEPAPGSGASSTSPIPPTSLPSSADISPAGRQPMSWRVVASAVAGLAALLLLALMIPPAFMKQAQVSQGFDADAERAAPRDVPASSSDFAAGDSAISPEDAPKMKLGAAGADAKGGAIADAPQARNLRMESAQRQQATPEAEEGGAFRSGAPVSARRRTLERLAPGDAAQGAGVAPQADDQAVAQGEQTERLMVVRLELPREALDQRQIDQLLARQDIVVRQEERETAYFRSPESFEERAAPPVADAATGGRAGSIEKGRPQNAPDRKVGRMAKTAVQSFGQSVPANLGEAIVIKDAADVVYVEADEEQVMAALEEIAAQPGFKYSLAHAESLAEVGQFLESQRQDAKNGEAAILGGEGAVELVPEPAPRAPLGRGMRRESGGRARSARVNEPSAAPPAPGAPAPADMAPEALSESAIAPDAAPQAIRPQVASGEAAEKNLASFGVRLAIPKESDELDTSRAAQSRAETRESQGIRAQSRPAQANAQSADEPSAVQRLQDDRPPRPAPLDEGDAERAGASAASGLASQAKPGSRMRVLFVIEARPAPAGPAAREARPAGEAPLP